MTDIERAELMLNKAVGARRDGDEVTANQLLRDAADLYLAAGETDMYQTCRMMIVSE